MSDPIYEAQAFEIAKMARSISALESDNDRLRELVADMWRDGMCDCDEFGACAKCEYGYLDRMKELGIEVEP